MKLKCGIIGLPNVGKSTFFNILTNKNVKNKNFPFCTIKPNIGHIYIEDKRLKKISKIINIKNIKYDTLNIIDIAGLINGASKGLGLGNNFLQDIKKVNILIHIVRFFENKEIINIHESINPLRDINIINNELSLSDINTLEKEEKKKTKFSSLIKKVIKNLEKYKTLLNLKFLTKENLFLKKLNLLTKKYQIYIFNINNKTSITDIKNTSNYLTKKFPIININIKKYENKFINKKKYNNKIVKLITKLLNLKTFFTINNTSITSWVLKSKTNSINAAKKIHTDFKKKFIKTQVVKFKNFIKYKNFNTLKKMGKIKYESKNYIIKDGDIIKFLINK